MEMIIWLAPAALLAGVVAGGVLWLGIRHAPPRAAIPTIRDVACDPARGASTFLIDEGRIIDSDHGRAPPPGTALEWPETWDDLRRWLAPRFVTLPAVLPALAGNRETVFPAAADDDAATLSITARGTRQVVKLHDPTPFSAASRHQARRAALGAQLFQDMADNTPVAICLLDGTGSVTWANRLFTAFPDVDANRLIEVAQGADGAAVVPARIGDRSFEVALLKAGDLDVIYITDTTRVVRADSVRNSFIQTLTKTFANLSTGLAVFDRTRRLVLFNPALVDLTGLSAEFLSARPDLPDFFDHLRDRQVLPEPRDYAGWRAQINEMVQTAAGGTYSEVWNLPNDLTYRVTGRPHPDGAVAFLVEDITDEISMTRRSRSQVEIRQAVLDRLEEAVAVFRPDGVLAFCNTPFRTLLGFDPDDRLTETGFGDVMSICARRLGGATALTRLAGNTGGLPRQPVETRLRDLPRGPAFCRVAPLTHGFVLFSLSRLPSVEPA